MCISIARFLAKALFLTYLASGCRERYSPAARIAGEFAMLPVRSIFVCAILLACPAIASAQVRFTQPAADLGELRGGPVYDHRFDFVNDSMESIEIVDIRLGCGCLQPVLEKRTFAPGEKGSLRMNIRTLGQSNGMRSWQAHVQTRQGTKTHETTIGIAATIRNEITVEPSILSLSVGSAIRQQVTITDIRKTPLKITRAIASTKAIRVSVLPDGNGITRIALDINGNALSTARHDALLTIYTDDPYYRELQVPITLMRAARADVTASPAKAEIVGSGVQLVRLRSAGDKAVRIADADSDHAGIKCSWAAGPGNDATLKISATAAASQAAIVRVRLSEPAGAVVTIPVTLRKD
jgi:hypothetical protein